MPSKSAERSGLVIAPGRVNSMILRRHYAKRQSVLVKVTTAAATEAILSLLIDASAEACGDNGFNTMYREHIHKAIISDSGLQSFFKDSCIIGVTPTSYLSSAIMASGGKRKKSKLHAIDNE